MKLTFFFMLLFTMQISAFVPIHGQVTLKIQNESLRDVFKEIENQSPYRFFYNESFADLNKRININVDDKDINSTMDELLLASDMSYKVLDNNLVVIAPRKELQQQVVTGRVTDFATGEGIPGVSIVIQGTTTGTTTNVDGEYSLSNVPPDAVLVVAFVGMITQEVAVEGRTEINIGLEGDVIHLDEVVAIGYGTQTKASLTGAVTVIDMEEISSRSTGTGNVVKALEGYVPGIEVSYSGNPNNFANLLIRGRGTLGASTAPLFVIDGVPTTRGLNELSVHDIESIQVLRDASAATIYGSRAANGVYLITTKAAKQGANLTFNSSATAGFITNSLGLMNTEQYGRAQWMAARNDDRNPNFGVYSFEDRQDADGNWVLDRIMWPEYIDFEQTQRASNTDWEDEISRLALSQNHNISFGLGTEHGNLLLSYDNMNSRGTTDGNEWNRNTLRINSFFKFFNDRLQVGENFSLTKMHYTGSSYIQNTRQIQSIVPVRTVDGEGWGGPVRGMSDRQNPRRLIEHNRQNGSNDMRILGSAYVNMDITNNLNFRSTIGADYVGYWERNMQLQYVSGYMSESVSKLWNSANYGGSWTWNNVLTYNFMLGNDNRFNIMLGQEATEAAGENVFAARDGFADEDINYMYLAVGEGNVRNDGLAWDNAQNSYFGRILYDYKSKYLLSAILRRDGSSRFGADQRYALFPSFSLGWVISSESFMESATWLSNLKIRYGWGRTGNQAIPNYASHSQYRAHYGDFDWLIPNTTAYDIYGAGSGRLPSGYRILQRGNPDLKWETTVQSNLGLDFDLFEFKLRGSIDYYYKETYDILVSPPTLTVMGSGSQRWVNGAELKNSGFEADLNYTDKAGDLNFTIGLNLYHNTNEFVYILPEAVGAYPGDGHLQTILGRPLNSFFGYVADGLFQNQAEVDAHAIQPGKGVGRIRYKDVNGDGRIDADDRTWIGVNEPKLIWGLNTNMEWRNFTFSAVLFSELGRDVNNHGFKSYNHFFGFFAGENYGTPVLDSWSPTNTSSTIPAITGANINNENRFSTYFVERTNFLKLQSISVGYNLTGPAISRMNVKSARIFLQAENLWTIKLPGNTYTGYDEKYTGMQFPLPRNITLGINLNL